jgi:hypothetical protein
MDFPTNKETKTLRRLSTDQNDSLDPPLVLSRNQNEWNGAAENNTVSVKAVKLDDDAQKEPELVWHITDTDTKTEKLCIEQKPDSP